MILWHVMWQFVTVTCDVMLISNPKPKNKKINENKIKMRKEIKISKVYYLQLWQDDSYINLDDLSVFYRIFYHRLCFCISY